jgi:ADP-ribosyl-[dinitrogen reductase] hydrolase
MVKNLLAKRNMNNQLNKCKGALLGLAIGDALGTAVEFLKPGTFEPITDIVGGGVLNLAAGKWTDDTSMALCLADSLIEKGEFDAFDQLEKYYKWFTEGYNSSEDECVDIGNATRSALYLYANSAQPYCGDISRLNAGNGSIVRLAPISIFYRNNTSSLIKYY